MTIVRRLTWGLAAVVLLLGLAAATLYGLFDQAAVRAQLIDQFAARTGRTLSIDGDIGLSVWPEVSIHLGRVSLSERDGITAFAHLDSARLVVAAAPLLSQHLVVKQVAIDGLVLGLVRDRQGQLNIHDLWATPPNDASSDVKPDTSASSPSADSTLAVDVAGINLSRARLSYHDQVSGQQWQLSDLNLHSGRLQAQPAVQQLAIEQLTLHTQGELGQARFNGQFDLPALQLTKGQLHIPQATLAAGWQDAARNLQAQLDIKTLQGSLSSLTVEELALTADARQAGQRLQAKLTSPVQLAFGKRQVALSGLGGSLQLERPDLPMKRLNLPLKGQLTVDWGKPLADLKLLSRLDDSALDLTLAVDRFAPLNFDFDVQVDRINVDRYRATSITAERSAKSANANSGGALASPTSTAEAKIDLSALKGLHFSGRVRVGQLQLSKLQLKAVDMRLRAADGRLDVAPLAAQLYDGRLSGQWTVMAQGSRFALKQQLQGISIQPLLQDLLQKDPLSGRGNVQLDVQTQGDTVSALKQALAGQARFDLRDGAINGFNVARRLREIKASLTGGLDGQNGAVTSEKTDFSELAASFRITQGVAHNDDLLLKAPFLRLGGEGDIDLVRSRIDYLARVSVVNTSSGQEGRDLAHLNGITIPLRLRGPFNQLSYSLELDRVLKDAARARFDEEKEALKQKAVNKLGDRLKNLLGR